MATRRIKEITNTATTFASDDFIALDGTTQGTRKMDKDDLIAEVSAGVSGDYLEEANNLSDVASLDTSKLNMEIPDVGTAPNEVPLSGQLGTMAFQDSAGVSVEQLEVTDKVDGTLNVESTDGLVASFERTGNAKLKVHSDANGPYFDTETGHNLRIFTNGGEAVRVNGSGQVGIGTPSPDSTLEVTGASATSNSGATVLVTDSASVAADIGGTIALRGTDGSTDRTLAVVKGGKVDGTSAFDGYLSLQTRSNGQANTTEAIHIDSSQRVGINTDSPGGKLTIETGSGNGLQLYRSAANANFDAITFRDTTNSSTNARIGFNVNELRLDGTTKIGFNTNGSEVAVIDSSGRVGVNNTSPGTMFSGANNLVIGNHSAANQGMTIASGSSNYGLIYFSDTTAGTGLYRGSVYYNHNLDTLGFSSAGTTQWSINSSGNLVAGTGNGIDFGSTTTGSGTVTGGLLDDYEEGTFTPVFADDVSGGNTATVTDAQGVYTKFGRVVSFSILLTNIDTTGLTAGNPAYIRGLPFDFGQTTVRWAGTVRLDSVTFSGYVTSNGRTNQSVLHLNDTISGAGDSNLLVSAFTSGSADVFITGTYQVG